MSNIRKGDEVIVLAGKDKGARKQGAQGRRDRGCGVSRQRAGNLVGEGGHGAL